MVSVPATATPMVMVPMMMSVSSMPAMVPMLPCRPTCGDDFGLSGISICPVWPCRFCPIGRGSKEQREHRDDCFVRFILLIDRPVIRVTTAIILRRTVLRYLFASADGAPHVHAELLRLSYQRVKFIMIHVTIGPRKTYFAGGGLRSSIAKLNCGLDSKSASSFSVQ